ncbi:MAG: hypothetical protein II943_06245 [Victivallales bacterium]|nr:hypothetical protein [Victivallales bacterium]
MNQNIKAIIAVVLLILAGGLFYWYFKPHTEPPTPETVLLDSRQAKALESIFSKVASKKWSDSSLWSSAEAAKKYSGVAKELFTESPSMQNVKVLDFGTIKEGDEPPYIEIEVPATGVRATIEFKAKSAKDDQLVINSITKFGN